MKYYILLLSFATAVTLRCLSPIEYMEPPICPHLYQLVDPIGLEKAYEYANLLFGNIHYTLNSAQRDCILNGPLKINHDIKTCVQQLTINNETKSHKVAQGLAKNSNDEWVSACATDMPCIEFNRFVYNHSFFELMDYCDATEIYNWLFNQTYFIESSWYGVKYCQHLYPDKCLYLEKEYCLEKERLYACPVSRWVYASNFMLFYMLSPEIAARLPGCRIMY